MAVMNDGGVVWFTGLPSAGKTTLATRASWQLAKERLVHLLDADQFRRSLCRDLGFGITARTENIRRASYVANLLSQYGVTVLCAFITPWESLRALVAESVKTRLCTVYVKCSLDCCMRRDVKGHYAKAKAGEMKTFTGVSSIFEEPKEVDVTVDTETLTALECLRLIEEGMVKKGWSRWLST